MTNFSSLARIAATVVVLSCLLPARAAAAAASTATTRGQWIVQQQQQQQQVVGATTTTNDVSSSSSSCFVMVGTRAVSVAAGTAVHRYEPRTAAAAAAGMTWSTKDVGVVGAEPPPVALQDIQCVAAQGKVWVGT